ncbi:MAG: DUF2017 domain-containing protein [Microbacteriaceae bacterium]
MIPFSRIDEGNITTITATFTTVERELITDLATSITMLLDDRASPPAADPLATLVGLGGSSTVSADPAIARLLPDAYAEDSTASREFRQLTEQSLATRKIANSRAVIDCLTRARGTGVRSDLGEDLGNDSPPDGDLAVWLVSLDDASAQSWLRSLSDIRLAVAARLGIEHDEGDEVDEGVTIESETDLDADPQEKRILRDVYNWLAYVLESLLAAIERDIPEHANDDR